MRRFGTGLVPWLVLTALGLGCFARLVADPTGLIADGRRPSLDFAKRGDTRPLGNDATFLFLPHHLYLAKILKEFGHLPAWDSTGFGGRPIIGNPQSGVFYPPVWIAWYSSNPAILGWLTFGHLFWGSLGLYLLARSQGLGRWPATVAAGVFQASPYLLAQTFEGHYPHVWSACWFPWAFWAWACVLQTAGRVRGLLALPIILAMTFVAGHPQEWLLLVIALSVWAAAVAFRLLVQGRGHYASAAAIVVLWASVLSVSLCLAAVELMPSFELLPLVQKSSQQESLSLAPRNYQLHLVNGLQLLSGEALGGPSDYFGADNFWESVLSFGLVPLVLVVAAVMSSPARTRVRGWIILVVLSLWFAAGRSLGLCTLVYWVVPGLSWFRVPARSLFLTSLGVAMLAGFGLETLRGRVSEPERWRRFALRLGKAAGMVLGLLLVCRQVGLLGLAGTTALSPAELRRSRGARNGSNQARWCRPVISRTSGERARPPITSCTIRLSGSRSRAWESWFAAGCLRNARSRPRRAAELLGLLAIAELAWHGFALIQVAPAELFFRPDPVSESLILANPYGTAGDTPRIRARDTFFLDLQAVRYGIEKTNVNDLFQLKHAAVLYESLYPVAARTQEPIDTPMSQAVDEYRRRVRQGVFDRMGVSALVSDRIEPDPPWPVVARGHAGGRDFVIQQNPTALPRAYVVPRAEVVADDPATVLSRFRSNDPRSAVLMTRDPLAGLPNDHRQGFLAASWRSLDPDRPVLEVRTQAPGLLVMADTWMPGWSALVDGRPAPILTGNHAQRVIPLEQPGHHTIVLHYDPPCLALGSMVTALSGLVWAAVGLRMVLRSRRPDSADSGCSVPPVAAPHLPWVSQERLGASASLPEPNVR